MSGYREKVTHGHYLFELDQCPGLRYTFGPVQPLPFPPLSIPLPHMNSLLTERSVARYDGRVLSPCVSHLKPAGVHLCSRPHLPSPRKHTASACLAGALRHKHRRGKSRQSQVQTLASLWDLDKLLHLEPHFPNLYAGNGPICLQSCGEEWQGDPVSAWR